MRRSSSIPSTGGGTGSAAKRPRTSNAKKVVDGLHRAITPAERRSALRAARVAFDHDHAPQHDEVIREHGAADALCLKLGFECAVSSSLLGMGGTSSGPGGASLSSSSLLSSSLVSGSPSKSSGSGGGGSSSSPGAKRKTRGRPPANTVVVRDEIGEILRLLDMLYGRCSVDTLHESFGGHTGTTLLELMVPMICAEAEAAKTAAAAAKAAEAAAKAAIVKAESSSSSPSGSTSGTAASTAADSSTDSTPSSSSPPSPESPEDLSSSLPPLILRGTLFRNPTASSAHHHRSRHQMQKQKQKQQSQRSALYLLSGIWSYEKPSDGGDGDGAASAKTFELTSSSSSSSSSSPAAGGEGGAKNANDNGPSSAAANSTTCTSSPKNAASSAHLLPAEGTFSGSFNLPFFAQPAGPSGRTEQRVEVIPEKDVTLTFTEMVGLVQQPPEQGHHPTTITSYEVEGRGTNRYGKFAIRGTATARDCGTINDDGDAQQQPTEYDVVLRKAYYAASPAPALELPVGLLSSPPAAATSLSSPSTVATGVNTKVGATAGGGEGERQQQRIDRQARFREQQERSSRTSLVKERAGLCLDLIRTVVGRGGSGGDDNDAVAKSCVRRADLLRALVDLISSYAATIKTLDGDASGGHGNDGTSSTSSRPSRRKAADGPPSAYSDNGGNAAHASLAILAGLASSANPEIRNEVAATPDVLLCFGRVLLLADDVDSDSGGEVRRAAGQGGNGAGRSSSSSPPVPGRPPAARNAKAASTAPATATTTTATPSPSASGGAQQQQQRLSMQSLVRSAVRYLIASPDGESPVPSLLRESPIIALAPGEEEMNGMDATAAGGGGSSSTDEDDGGEGGDGNATTLEGGEDQASDAEDEPNVMLPPTGPHPGAFVLKRLVDLLHATLAVPTPPDGDMPPQNSPPTTAGTVKAEGWQQQRKQQQQQRSMDIHGNAPAVIALVGATLDSLAQPQPQPQLSGPLSMKRADVALLRNSEIGNAIMLHLDGMSPTGEDFFLDAERLDHLGDVLACLERLRLHLSFGCDRHLLVGLFRRLLKRLNQQAVELFSSESTQQQTIVDVSPLSIVIGRIVHILFCLTSSSFSPEDDNAARSIRRCIVEREEGLLSELVTIADPEKFRPLPANDKAAFEFVALCRQYAVGALANLSCDASLRNVVMSHPRLLFVLCETVHELHDNAEATGATSNVEGRILDAVAEALKSLTMIDRDMNLASRKQLVQALVMLMTKRDGCTAKARRCAAGAVQNLSSFCQNGSMLAKHGSQQLFAALSNMACNDEDASVRLASASAIQNLACNDDVTELMAINFSTIVEIARAASAPNDIVGEHASAALHKLIPFLSAEDLRSIMTDVASISTPARSSTSSIRHNLMVPSAE